MSQKTEIQKLHECWNRKVKPILDNIACGKLGPIHKGELLRQCFESYAVSPFKIEYMILKFYIEPGMIQLSKKGEYVAAIEVSHVA